MFKYIYEDCGEHSKESAEVKMSRMLTNIQKRSIYGTESGCK
jgi:hypothetical protein